MKTLPASSTRCLRELGRVICPALLGMSMAAVPGSVHAQTKAGQKQEARRLLDEGISLLQKNDFENACSRLRESQALDPRPATEAEIDKCKEKAQALFDLGRDLFKKQDFRAACPQFEQSMRLDPSAGTQVNIASCLARKDQNYSAACLAYQEARRMNRSEKDESDRARREAAISKDLKDIAQYLPKLRVQVPPYPGLLVSVDGNRIDQAMLADPFTICPGQRAIEISALERETQTYSLLVAGTETKYLKVELPPRAGKPRAAAVTPAEPGRAQRIAGIVTGGLGVVGLGVTVGLSVDAVYKRDDYIGQCPNEICPSLEVGTTLRREAEKSRDAAIITGVAGGALLALGVAAYVTAPAASTGPSPPAVTLRISPAGVAMEGRW